MMKPGFTNSDGWNEAKPSEYQRIAPLPKSLPRKGSKASATKDRAKPTMPMRRTISGESIEAPIITASAMAPNCPCLIT